MSLSHAAQARILREDAYRRYRRQVTEDAILGLDLPPDPLSDAARIAKNRKQGTQVNACLVRGVGTVNPPLPTSASRNSWDRGMTGRTVGIAPGTEDSSDGTPTVAVTIDGTTTIVPASTFRKERRATTHTRATATVVPETATVQLKGMDWSQ